MNSKRRLIKVYWQRFEFSRVFPSYRVSSKLPLPSECFTPLAPTVHNKTQQQREALQQDIEFNFGQGFCVTSINKKF
jgi:hypothetical protein